MVNARRALRISGRLETAADIQTADLFDRMAAIALQQFGYLITKRLIGHEETTQKQGPVVFDGQEAFLRDQRADAHPPQNADFAFQRLSSLFAG
jgi:hypothetical protein